MESLTVKIEKKASTRAAIVNCDEVVSSGKVSWGYDLFTFATISRSSGFCVIWCFPKPKAVT